MGECKLDHSKRDVKQKLESQISFLPEDLADEWPVFLEKELSQQTLNEAFHLLKKYDLASDEERKDRNKQMSEMFSSIKN